MKKIIGLTGGIASGKSAAAKYFREAGAYTIDTDVISRKVADGDEAKSALKQRFPLAFCGSSLNRKRLREIVFADPSALAALNAIMHPLIYRETEREINGVSSGVVVVEAPLLIEAAFDKLADVVITVSCDENVRIKRLVERDAITEDLARRMIAAQLSDAEREAKADEVISGSGSLAELRAQVIRIYTELA